MHAGEHQVFPRFCIGFHLVHYVSKWRLLKLLQASDNHPVRKAKGPPRLAQCVASKENRCEPQRKPGENENHNQVADDGLNHCNSCEALRHMHAQRKFVASLFLLLLLFVRGGFLGMLVGRCKEEIKESMLQNFKPIPINYFTQKKAQTFVGYYGAPIS
jgi:hypothetical protein